MFVIRARNCTHFHQSKSWCSILLYWPTSMPFVSAAWSAKLITWFSKCKTSKVPVKRRCVYQPAPWRGSARLVEVDRFISQSSSVAGGEVVVTPASDTALCGPGYVAEQKRCQAARPLYLQGLEGPQGIVLERYWPFTCADKLCARPGLCCTARAEAGGHSLLWVCQNGLGGRLDDPADLCGVCGRVALFSLKMQSKGRT